MKSLALQASSVELTIFPLSGGRINDAKEFVVCHSLRVKINGGRCPTIHEVSMIEGAPDLALSGSCTAVDKDGVTYRKKFVQLHNLPCKGTKWHNKEDI